MSQNISENKITKQIIEGLEYKGYRVFKIFNGGVFGGVRNGKAVFRQKDPKYKGVSDLIAINKKDNKLLFIEVKGKGGSPSDEQLQFIDMVDGIARVRGCLAYNFGGVEKLINKNL